MPAKKILIVYGHPLNDSFNTALAKAYKKGAEAAGAEVKELVVHEMDFNPVLEHAYTKRMELEQHLLDFQEKVLWAEHLVFAFPTWWGGVPAKVKGLFDRAFHPGWAFKFHEGKALPEKLLKGRSGQIITTMDNFPFLYRLLYKAPGIRQVKDMTLKFCGISPVKVMAVGSVKLSSDAKRKKWLNKAKKLGKCSI